jgi:hypothetical protein
MLPEKKSSPSGSIFLMRKATCVNRTGGFFLPEIIDKTIVVWYDIFKNSTAVRKIDKKESE